MQKLCDVARQSERRMEALAAPKGSSAPRGKPQRLKRLGEA